MISPKKTALLLTVAAAAIVFLWLRFTSLSLKIFDKEWPPRHDQDITLAETEETFFDVIEDLPEPVLAQDQASAAQNPEPTQNNSEPKPQSGNDLTDRGPQGDAPKPVTTKKPSPVKKKPQENKKPVGPSKEELERQRQQEEARRKANDATTSAFQKSSGKENTSSKGKTDGHSGSPTGKSTSVSGSGSGTVGGGWVLPKYAKVPSNVTGSIKMMVKIDAQGAVKSVSFQGGEAPAATNSALLAAVKAEVASRRFSRPAGSQAPQEATAYITYIFK